MYRFITFIIFSLQIIPTSKQKTFQQQRTESESPVENNCILLLVIIKPLYKECTIYFALEFSASSLSIVFIFLNTQKF